VRHILSHLRECGVLTQVGNDYVIARKPDHQLAALQEKIAVTPQLTFNGARILELDGRQPADEILQASLRAIHAALS
ncbi:MAG: hypothetical protein E7L37_18620, partial [Escherichia coli]|nr:hypothetical protein [Escherichia coli]